MDPRHPCTLHSFAGIRGSSFVEVLSHFTLAMLRIEAGELDAAEESLRRAETLGADPRPLGLARALLCRSHGQFAEADGILRRVPARDRDYKPAAALLLQNARARGKENEALDHLHGLAAPGPDDSSFLELRLTIRPASGRLPAAARSGRPSRRSRPSL